MRARRTAAAVLTGLVVTAAWWAPPPADAVDPLPPEPVTIAVEATRDISLAQSTPWADAFIDSLTSLQYRPTSSSRARDHLLAGLIDAAIIGTPYTEEELAASKVSGTIEVPIHVSAAMILFAEPFNSRFAQLKVVSPEEDPFCDPLSADYDPAGKNPLDPEDDCEVRTEFTGPLRVPPANLAAMMLDLGTDGLNQWQHPDVKVALGAPNLIGPRPSDAPTFVHREPGESVNRHVQQYIVTAAPSVWELAKLANPGVPFEVDESIPRGMTRNTPSSQAQQVALTTGDPAGASDTWFGNMADIPPAIFAETKRTYPDIPYKVVQIRNAADEWVEPTPASISAAVASGGTEPLHALSTPVAGAYPLVWVDHLSVPNSGLSAEKANAVAGLIRFVAARGQEGAAALGEGRLPDALVQEALRGADAVVEANCTGSDVQLVSNGAVGAYAPPALAEAGIASMKHCERISPAEPLPSASAPSDAAAIPFGPSDPGFSSAPAPASSSQAAGGTATTPAAAGASGPTITPVGAAAPPARAPVDLPFGLLANTRPGLDRVVTILLGGGLFLLVRATIWPRLRKALNQ